MTKKDYEAIAKVFRTVNEGMSSKFEPTLFLLRTGIADVMQADNPRFSRSRFLAACRGENAKDSAGRTVTYAR